MFFKVRVEEIEKWLSFIKGLKRDETRPGDQHAMETDQGKITILVTK